MKIRLAVIDNDMSTINSKYSFHECSDQLFRGIEEHWSNCANDYTRLCANWKLAGIGPFAASLAYDLTDGEIDKKEFVMRKVVMIRLGMLSDDEIGYLNECLEHYNRRSNLNELHHIKVPKKRTYWWYAEGACEALSGREIRQEQRQAEVEKMLNDFKI